MYRQYWTREAQTGDVKLENSVQDNVVQDNVVHRTPNTKERLVVSSSILEGCGSGGEKMYVHVQYDRVAK